MPGRFSPTSQRGDKIPWVQRQLPRTIKHPPPYLVPSATLYTYAGYEIVDPKHFWNARRCA